MTAWYRALGDLFTPRFLLLSLLPLLVVLPLLGVALASLAGGFGEVGAGSGESHWLVEAFASLPWLGGLAELGWFRALLVLVGRAAGWLLILLAALFLAVALVGMLAPAIVREVRRRHYPDVALRGAGGLVDFLRMLLRTLGVFVLLWLPVIPLLFVPLVNVLAINLPFFYWFHRLLAWDVATTIFDADEYRRLAPGLRASVLAHTALLYPFSLLPGIGLLLQVAFVLVLAHVQLARARQRATAVAGGVPPPVEMGSR